MARAQATGPSVGTAGVMTAMPLEEAVSVGRKTWAPGIGTYVVEMLLRTVVEREGDHAHGPQKGKYYNVNMRYEVCSEGFIGSTFRVQWAALGKAVRSPLRFRLLAPIRSFVRGVAVEAVPWGGRNLALAVAASRMRPFHPCIPVQSGMNNGTRRMPRLRQAPPSTADTLRAASAWMLGKPR